MKAYKGFDKNLQCRGFQYAVGKEYETDKAEICRSGFHACEAPLNVWDFYPPINNNRFCEVEQDGDVKNDGAGVKSVSTKIKIGAEIGIPELIKAHVELCKKQTAMDATKMQVTTSGNDAKIGSSGCDAQIGSSGCDAQIGSSGDDAKIGSSGDDAKIGSSGYGAKIGSSGDDAKIGSSGYGAKIGSSGCDAQIGSSGDGAQIGSSGCDAQIGSSGDGAKIGSSGDGAKIGSSGNGAKIECFGRNAVVACAGANNIVKAPKGAWICLSEFDMVDSEYVCVGMKAFRIDGKKFLPDTWYKLVKGSVVKVG